MGLCAYVWDREARGGVGLAFLWGRGADAVESRFEDICINFQFSVYFDKQAAMLPLDQRMRKSPMLNTIAPLMGGAETKWPGLCGSSTSSPPHLSSGSWKRRVQ